MQWRLEVILPTVQHKERFYGFLDSHQKEVTFMKLMIKQGLCLSKTNWPFTRGLSKIIMSPPPPPPISGNSSDHDILFTFAVQNHGSVCKIEL